MEVRSSSTALRDRGKKFRLYEKHGVREYWLVDAEAKFVEVYTLSEGKFVRQGAYGPGESFKSSVLPIEEVKVDALLG